MAKKPRCCSRAGNTASGQSGLLETLGPHYNRHGLLVGIQFLEYHLKFNEPKLPRGPALHTAPNGISMVAGAPMQSALDDAPGVG